MTSVDIKNPEIMKKLKEKLKDQLGKDLTEEEILEKCLDFSFKHLNQLLSENDSKLTHRSKLLNKPRKNNSFSDYISDILEDEYNEIIKSGKTVKDVIRESWKY